MKLALIGLGGYSGNLVMKEAEAYFSKIDFFDIRHVEVRADKKEVEVLHKGNKIEDYDCVYIRGSFNYALLQRALAYAFKDSYVPMTPDSFGIGHDKFLTLMELQKANVSIPKTYLAGTTKIAKKLLEDVHYPIIMKIPSGTQGKGVMSADSIASAKSMLDTLEVFKQPYIIQEYIETDATDVRAIVAGGKVVAAMKRKGSTNERRSNIHQGGSGVAYELSYDAEKAAIKSAKALKADICGVDILEDHKGIYVIEVNLSPGLRGITAATKKNIAKSVAKVLHDKTLEFKKVEKKNGYKDIIKEMKTSHDKEVLMNLDIKGGRIRLPEMITKITGFDSDDEIVLTADRGKLNIKKMEIEKD